MNLRQVKRKTKSIGNVKKITKAMQLVSAVKMKKAQQLAIEGRAYRESLDRIIAKVMPSADKDASALLSAKGKGTRKLIIFVSSNKGLCGPFNVNLFRLLLKNTDFHITDFISIGKKGSAFVSRMGSKVIADYSLTNPLLETSAIFELVIKNFFSGAYKEVQLVYNTFISTLRSDPSIETLLPFVRKEEVPLADKTFEYLIEPSPEELIEKLLMSYLEEKIRGAIMNSEAVEHSSRMIAMKNATDNANDVIYNLTLLGNKLRQEKITNELLDMITAKESVES